MVVSGLLLILMTVGPLDVGIFQAALIPLTLAFGCLGWASGGGDSPWRRWASRGLLVLAVFGVLSVTWRLLGLPTGRQWLWRASLQAALRAAVWATLGVWLRSATTPLSGDGLSKPNLRSRD